MDNRGFEWTKEKRQRNLRLMPEELKQFFALLQGRTNGQH